MSIEGQGHFLTIIFQVLYVLCFTRPRYQVSVYRTIGPLVSFCSRIVLLSTLCGPSRVLDYFHPVKWCLRLVGDLERLWWKLFILVNLDLSEIHKNNSGFWTSRPFGDDSLWPR